ncbi:hypothetical protein AAEX28_14985 [Lentisphaerota bacterium WC36G]|nr:hypothetical protein LJT99_01740 [Lentisphaerae bacterium WC36]
MNNEIKKNKILKCPITLHKLREVLPKIKYSSRTYTPFDERLRKCFFDK